MRFGTKAIHAGVEPDPTTGAIMTPIYQTSTYVQAAPGDHKGYEYSRTHNPTRTALQNALAALENGTHGLCFATGMASIDAICKLFKPGDEIVSTNDLYGGTYRLFTKIFEGFGLKFRFVDMGDPANVAAAMTPNTKLIWVETPTNPLLKVMNLVALLVLPAVFSLADYDAARALITVGAVVVILGSVLFTKRQGSAMTDEPAS